MTRNFRFNNLRNNTIKKFFIYGTAERDFFVFIKSNLKQRYIGLQLGPDPGVFSAPVSPARSDKK